MRAVIAGLILGAVAGLAAIGAALAIAARRFVADLERADQLDHPQCTNTTRTRPDRRTVRHPR